MSKTFRGAIGAFVVAGALVLSACGGGGSSTDDGSAAGSAAAPEAAAASATSLEDFGSMADLEAAAKAEGALNVIALPHNWANYGEVIAAFKAKYPEITINEQNPNASSKEEIDAANTNKGTDKAPDVFDLGAAVATEYADMFAPYKVQAFEDIPAKDDDGRYYADYTGIMAIGYNKTKFGEINSIEDLTDPKFASTVALNGKPAEAGAAFNGFLMVNLAAGGDLQNLQPGMDFFKKLKDAGTLTTIDVTDATIASGQTGVVFDWSYNQVAYQAALEQQGVEWEYKVFPGSEVASYYYQAINADAPHPAAARLWMEFLYTPEAQNLWLKGGASPALLEVMKADGTVDQDILEDQIQTSQAPLTYTQEDNARITAWLQENWDSTLGN